MEERKGLTKYAWLSIATAVLTILLKMVAFLVTGSVGLLSDALESTVNLVAAFFALAALSIAAQPPDEEHAYGHAKVEYFASGVEGTLILIAAITISITAVNRLINPQPLEQVGLGLVVSVIAALLNFIVARIILRAGRNYRSVTLVANAKHLLTDVWTTVGVLVGIVAVVLTGWERLDPLIALLVAAQILVSGVKLLRSSVSGLMDTALPADEVRIITETLDQHSKDGIQYHALRTRESGALRFMSVHIQVPGSWTVQEGHTLLEELERDIRRAISPISVFTHIEPVEDPSSWEDISIDRQDE
jgi:cation diffusion facilitator family transporter